MIDLDLTGAEVKIVGNSDDTHLFRLTNPIDQAIITTEVDFEAEFISHLGVSTNISIDETQKNEGILIIPVTIMTGNYYVRRVNPRRTLVIIKVESR